ncbi:MAG: TerC family protein [Alphaproteobacteria bacterium]|nr:TerC family protein [Alphaproteobacteria bacterium]
MLPQELLTPEVIASFLTLTFLEIVLAGDNLVLIAILSGKLPVAERPSARRFGIAAAVITRLGLLFTLFYLAHLQAPTTLNLPGGVSVTITPRELVLAVGGLFLIWKSLSEISALFRDGGHVERKNAGARPWSHTFFWTVVQIALFDIVFSLDSVIAAIGIAQRVEVMAAAIVSAAFIMLFLVNPISNFIDRFIIVRLVALNFLTLIGSLLIAQAIGIDIPRIYFYEALAIAVVVQILALIIRTWSAGTRTSALTLAFLALVAVAAAVLYMNKEAGAPQRVESIVVQALTDLEKILAALVDWVRSLL